MTTLPRRALRDARTLITSPIALAVLLLLVLGTGSLIAFFPHEGAAPAATAQEQGYPPLTDQDRINLAKWWDVQPKEELPMPTENAKVVVVKFSDFMCPGCRQTYEAYKPIVEKFAGNKDVKFITKQYPLEPECNPNVPTGTHFASCEAAAAVVMARSKGTADKLEAWLFTNQATLTRDVVRKAALDVGGVPDFDARYDSAMQEVKMDAGLGALVRIESTPTFFINGRRIKGGIAPQAFEGLIELELQRAK